MNLAFIAKNNGKKVKGMLHVRRHGILRRDLSMQNMPLQVSAQILQLSVSQNRLVSDMRLVFEKR
jgi:hypothetical protein